MRYLIIVALIVSSSCAAKVKPATVAHYGTDILTVVSEIQKSSITLNNSGTLSVGQTKAILDTIREVTKSAEKLSSALKLWDATGSGLSSVLLSVADVQNGLNQLLGNNLPPQISELTLNALRLTSSIISGISNAR